MNFISNKEIIIFTILWLCVTLTLFLETNEIVVTSMYSALITVITVWIYYFVKAVVNDVKKNREELKKRKEIAQKRKEIAQKRKEIAQKRKEAGLTIEGEFKHICGLPIPENQICNVYSYPEKYEFEVNGLNIKLQRNKITDLSVKTYKELSRQPVSSIGGTIGGAVIGGILSGSLGVLGAIIGGRAKRVSTRMKYLIITYIKDEQVYYVGFELDTSKASSQAVLFEREFQNYKSQKFIENKQIDL